MPCKAPFQTKSTGSGAGNLSTVHLLQELDARPFSPFLELDARNFSRQLGCPCLSTNTHRSPLSHLLTVPRLHPPVLLMTAMLQLLTRMT